MNRHDKDLRSREGKPTASRTGASGSMASNIAMLVFGLLTLLYLVAIDHEEWFHLRPISGVAIALSQAAEEQPAEAAPQSAPRSGVMPVRVDGNR